MKPRSTSTDTIRGMDDVWLAGHRSHDVVHLLQRWRAVARRAKLKVTTIYETGGYPVYFLTAREAGPNPLYFSTGVHGDEAASVVGLLEWAERSIDYLKSADAVLLPLFNPVGLALNTRTDADGTDLNRCFDHPTHPHILGWKQVMANFIPRLAVCLHEDYDAQGMYAYELNRRSKPRPAEYCLNAAQGILPLDSRKVIEGRPARLALIRRTRLPMFQDLPEAVALYQVGTPCTITFETPSEYALPQRAHAQVRLLQALVEWDASNAGVF